MPERESGGPGPPERGPGYGAWPDGEPDLPLWELIQTSHVVARGFTALFASVGLTPTQFGVLATLAAGEDLTQAELARAVMVRPQSMNELFVSLLKRGLVDRDGPGGRGRRAGLRITDTGRELLARAQPKVEEFNAPEAIGLSAAEAAELSRMLRVVRDTLA
ncbi:MarR family transcriptional regulator [Nonomuraea mesophila]|uniref:MarR family transcriptional regulator n=1 Tax=Nonomuraea mesophila TaxID=2530382 RepID=A0A4R5E8B4_9ACTN|nr:MarR family winged helix-turn-helix transcriptional regulator [Nonomuraea mesophila]TDE27329.1 MarR family transcriptional regulator [Nonomuraea mesophila]